MGTVFKLDVPESVVPGTQAVTSARVHSRHAGSTGQATLVTFCMLTQTYRAAPAALAPGPVNILPVPCIS